MSQQQLPKIAWVHWKDACFQNEGNVNINDVDGPLPLLSCGVFVKETDEYIAIAIDRDLDAKRDAFRSVQTIPKVNIVAYKVLSIMKEGNAVPETT